MATNPPVGTYGPNTHEVEQLLDRLRRLSGEQWEAVRQAAPQIGSVPDLEIAAAPGYFRALDAATRTAKRPAFPGSETAFYEAMRVAQVTAASAIESFTRAQVPGRRELGSQEPAREGDPEAITRLMAAEFDLESWRHAVSASMVAAGALVVRDWLPEEVAATLWRPLTSVIHVPDTRR